MRKMIVVLSAIATALILASCSAMKNNTDNTMPAADSASTSGAAHHHDYKGESSTK